MAFHTSFTIYLSFLCETGEEAEKIARLSPRQRTEMVLSRSRSRKIVRKEQYNKLLLFFKTQSDRAMDPISAGLLLDVPKEEAIEILMELVRFGRVQQMSGKHLWLLTDGSLFEIDPFSEDS